MAPLIRPETRYREKKAVKTTAGRIAMIDADASWFQKI
jgi:hypothetical protein